MKFKIGSSGIKKKFSFPIYLIIYAISGILGYAFAGLPGLAVGLAGSVVISLFTFLGIIPFAGIPLYIFFSDLINGLLLKLVPNAWIALTVAKIAFGFFVVIVNIFVSLLVLLVLLALLAGKR